MCKCEKRCLCMRGFASVSIYIILCVCTITVLDRHSYLNGPPCDPAVVKVDEHQKLCLTTKRFIPCYQL